MVTTVISLGIKEFWAISLLRPNMAGDGLPALILLGRRARSAGSKYLN